MNSDGENFHSIDAEAYSHSKQQHERAGQIAASIISHFL